MTLPCPHCRKPIVITRDTFRPGESEVSVTCGGCEGEVRLRRRPRGYEYRAEKPTD